MFCVCVAPSFIFTLVLGFVISTYSLLAFKFKYKKITKIREYELGIISTTISRFEIVDLLNLQFSLESNHQTDLFVRSFSCAQRLDYQIEISKFRISNILCELNCFKKCQKQLKSAALIRILSILIVIACNQHIKSIHTIL